MRKQAIIITAVIIFFLVLIPMFLMSSIVKRSYWECKNGVWVKHGNPSETAPETGCGDEDIFQNVTSFEECVNAGNPVMESYPRQCSAGGETFVEDIGNELAMADQIIVNYPRPNDILDGTFNLTGEARGTWFFEATFSIRLIDDEGNVLFAGPVMTTEDWMTESFIPFQSEVVYNKSASKNGTLILEKANPSAGSGQVPSDLEDPSAGSGQGIEQLEIPVKF